MCLSEQCGGGTDAAGLRQLATGGSVRLSVIFVLVLFSRPTVLLLFVRLSIRRHFDERGADVARHHGHLIYRQCSR